MAVPIHRRAEDDLRFIRHAMERSSQFTAVPGRGGAGMGVIGVIAAVIASGQPSRERWLIAWLAAAAVALVVGVITMRRKAIAAGVLLTGSAARRFALSLSAPLVAGAALTFGLGRAGIWSMMPATWLLLYGSAVVAGGLHSVRVVLVLGICFMALGVVALMTPPTWGDAWLGTGFGVLQIGFGLYIARRHGG